MKDVDPHKRLRPGYYAWYRRSDSQTNWHLNFLFQVEEDGSYHNRMPGRHGPFNQFDRLMYGANFSYLKPNRAKEIRKLVSFNDEEADQIYRKLAKQHSEEEVQIGDCFTLFAYENYDGDDEEMYPGAIVRVVDFGRSMTRGVRHVIVQIISRNGNPKRAALEVDPTYVFYPADPNTRTINFMEKLKLKVRDLDLGSVLAMEEIPDYMDHHPDSCRLSTEEAMEAEPMWEHLEPR